MTQVFFTRSFVYRLVTAVRRHGNDACHVLGKVGLFCCAAMDLTPQLPVYPASREDLLLTLLKLANTANGFGFARFIRQFAKDHVRLGHFTVFRIMHRNCRQGEDDFHLQPSPADRFRRVRLHLNRLIRFSSASSLHRRNRQG